MTCCIVGFLILAAIGRVRRAVGRAPAAPMLFAPVARRPAPGQVLDPVAEPAPAPVLAVSPVLRYFAVGIALCLAGAPLLVLAGAVDNTGSALTWLLRCAVYLAVIVAVLRLGPLLPRLPAPPGAGTLLIVVGAVVFELGVVDMHVFRLFDFPSSQHMGDLVFHNVGPGLAMIGGLVLLYGSLGRRTTSRRSSRSTVTSAAPLSSAVTVPSTPPITT